MPGGLSVKVPSPLQRATHRLVGDLGANLGNGLLGHVRLEDETEVLDSALEVTLVVLEQLRHVVARKTDRLAHTDLANPLEGHAVGPLEENTRLDDDADSVTCKLDLDPGQVSAVLHLLHLLLSLLVELGVELGRLLVVRPAVEVLNGVSKEPRLVH